MIASQVHSWFGNQLISEWVSAKVRGAIIEVTEGMEAAAAGDLKVELDPPALEETGAMVEAFNEMIGNVRAGRDALET